jgi:hypothetical protein
MGPEERGEGGSSVSDSNLATLVRCLGGAQANANGASLFFICPIFKGRHVEYPKFKKEWWAYQRMYHAHVRAS